MAVRKISPISTFTIFLTILLLSSRIYCEDNGYDEECEDDDSSGSEAEAEAGNIGPGKWPGSNPGKDPGSNPGKGPGSDPGKGPGSDPGKGPGSDPGKGPGSDPGKGPGSDPGKGPGSDPLKELGSDILGKLGSIPGLGDLTKNLEGVLDPSYLKGLLDYGGELFGIIKPAFTTIINSVDKVVTDPESILENPAPFLKNLATGTLGPLSKLITEGATEISSEGNAVQNEIFNNLPPELSALQDPVQNVLGAIDNVNFIISDAAEGAASLDGAAVVKALGGLGSALTNVVSTLSSLSSTLQITGA